MAATAFLSPDPVLKFLSNTLRRPEESLTLENREDLRKAEKAIRNLKVIISFIPKASLSEKESLKCERFLKKYEGMPAQNMGRKELLYLIIRISDECLI